MDADCAGKDSDTEEDQLAVRVQARDGACAALPAADAVDGAVYGSAVVTISLLRPQEAGGPIKQGALVRTLTSRLIKPCCCPVLQALSAFRVVALRESFSEHHRLC